MIAEMEDGPKKFRIPAIADVLADIESSRTCCLVFAATRCEVPFAAPSGALTCPPSRKIRRVMNIVGGARVRKSGGGSFPNIIGYARDLVER